MEFRPKCMASAVGSMPHEDAAKAVDLVMATIPKAPIWPHSGLLWAAHGDPDRSE